MPPPTVDPKLLDVPGNPNLFYVLGNDRAGPTGVISIPSNGLDDSATAGTVNLELATIDGKSVQVVRYTPATGFNGTDQFRYTIVDSNGTTSTGTVTVQVGNTCTSDDLVRIRLETRDLNGNLITQIGQGMQFQVWAYVRDIGTSPAMLLCRAFPRVIRACFLRTWICCTTPIPCHMQESTSRRLLRGAFRRRRGAGNPGGIGAFQGSGSDKNFGNPYGPSEKLLYKATFTATELGRPGSRAIPPTTSRCTKPR